MSKLMILVIEDDELLCELTKDVLEARGHTVISSCNEESALKMMKEFRFDVYIVDYRITPHTNTIELIKTQRIFSPQSLIIGCSADKKSEALFKQAGANAFFNKPFSYESLADFINSQ